MESVSTVDVAVPVQQRPVDEQVHRALLEARAVAFAFIRLGGVARPELAWRCEVFGRFMVDKLADTFGSEIAE